MERQNIAREFRRWAPMVYRRALVLLGNAAAAEDATQEVFIRAFQSAEKFQERSRVSTWLYRITTNYCLNRIRDEKQRAALLEQHLAGEPEPIRGAPDDVDLVLLRRLLSEADEDEARAAICVYVDGMSHDEAAQVLEVSRRTIGNMLERFNKWARARLGAAGNIGT